MKYTAPSQLYRLACILLTLFLGMSELMPAHAFGASDPSSSGKQGGVHQPIQPVAQADPALLPLWAILEGKAKGKVTVFWNAGSGSPKSIFGSLSESMTPSESSARRFLSDHAQLFRVDPTLSDLVLTRQTASLIGTQFVFTQRHHGIPVYDGQIKVLFDREGRVRAVNNSYVPLTGAVDPIPLMSASQAMEVGRTHLEKSQPQGLIDETVPAPIANLVVSAEDGTPRLVWEVIHHT